MNEIKPNFSKRVLDRLPENIKLPDELGLLLPIDAYLHPEFMRDSINSYLERRRNRNAEVSKSTS